MGAGTRSGAGAFEVPLDEASRDRATGNAVVVEPGAESPADTAPMVAVPTGAGPAEAIPTDAIPMDAVPPEPTASEPSGEALNGAASEATGEAASEASGRASGKATGETPAGQRGGRARRVLLAVLVAVAVVVPVSGFSRPAVPAPTPAVLDAPTRDTLERTYAANRANAAWAAEMAEEYGARGRAAADRAMAGPDRRFLRFDGRGPGQAVEVFGDLARADRVAVLVPGSDTSIDTYDRFREGALALKEQLDDTAPEGGARTAVVAWLGYETPRTISTTAITPDRAESAAPALRAFVRELRGVVGKDARISLLCHSYGSVVCAAAADADRLSGPERADALVLIGSPGTGAGSAAELGSAAKVWAARGDGDWIANVPHTRAELLGTTVGFGTDPVSPAFGARVFTAGEGGHSDYFRPGTESLRNLARIVLGATSEVTRA